MIPYAPEGIAVLDGARGRRHGKTKMGEVQASPFMTRAVCSNCPVLIRHDGSVKRSPVGWRVWLRQGLVSLPSKAPPWLWGYRRHRRHRRTLPTAARWHSNDLVRASFIHRLEWALVSRGWCDGVEFNVRVQRREWMVIGLGVSKHGKHRQGLGFDSSLRPGVLECRLERDLDNSTA